MHYRLVQRHPPQLQGSKTAYATLMPKYAHPWSLPKLRVHHDRPITVPFLDRRRGREELS